MNIPDKKIENNSTANSPVNFEETGIINLLSNLIGFVLAGPVTGTGLDKMINQ